MFCLLLLDYFVTLRLLPTSGRLGSTVKKLVEERLEPLLKKDQGLDAISSVGNVSGGFPSLHLRLSCASLRDLDGGHGSARRTLYKNFSNALRLCVKLFGTPVSPQLSSDGIRTCKALGWDYFEERLYNHLHLGRI
ncbi:hypothetical protein BKA82DRAFT_991627 [Pisolithus tinctorius]|uniref:Uncharacterized protein n=1 Tax=Pisolithus tinctorius Marx 270 TaxID=870435 RepID=A0A0C3KZL0_PISTI|nr:hypothetical protein BKA82DRAFT_991627 [Pisolithus tinctorius]KIO14887.1 hypothetical protein M404DRAFT_991627 [Pisolithus tinctorius Marx 270]